MVAHSGHMHSEILERFCNFRTIPKFWIDSEICLLIAIAYILH